MLGVEAGLGGRSREAGGTQTPWPDWPQDRGATQDPCLQRSRPTRSPRSPPPPRPLAPRGLLAWLLRPPLAIPAVPTSHRDAHGPVAAALTPTHLLTGSSTLPGPCQRLGGGASSTQTHSCTLRSRRASQSDPHTCRYWCPVTAVIQPQALEATGEEQSLGHNPPYWEEQTCPGGHGLGTCLHRLRKSWLKRGCGSYSDGVEADLRGLFVF